MSKGTEFSRVQLDKGVSNHLRRLKGDTGLPRNYLCRIGLCYSLREPRPPAPQSFDSEGQELGRYLLLGDHDPLYIAMVKERLIVEGRDPDEDFYEQFVAHINRGVKQLAGRTSDLTDLYDLIPGELKETQQE